jgi:hypothetical protein
MVVVFLGLLVEAEGRCRLKMYAVYIFMLRRATDFGAIARPTRVVGL